MKSFVARALLVVALAACASVTSANNLFVNFHVVDCNGNPLQGVSIGLTGCVDPVAPYNTPVVTGADGIASFLANPVQFCFGAALETCGWTVSYNGAPVVANGPVTLTTPAGTPISPRAYACGCDPAFANAVTCPCCSEGVAPTYPTIELSIPTLGTNCGGCPNITIGNPVRGTICGGATSATIAYRVSSSNGAPLLVNAQSITGGVTCSAPSTPVTSGTDVTVTCTGPFPSTFQVGVSAKTVGATGSCDVFTYRGIDTILTQCCTASSETAMARSPSNVCFRAAPAPLSCRNWGFLNSLAGDLPSTSYPLIAGAGGGATTNQCLGGTNVGSVAVSCTTSGGSSTFTFESVTNNALGAVSPAVFAGCLSPTNCVPGQGYGAVSACTAAPSVASTSCGGPLGSLQPGTTVLSKAYKLACTCSKVQWVYHESANFITSVTDGACPL